MAVYVDDMYAQFGRMKMCHMMADSLEELHDMAFAIGLKPNWFQDKPRFPHYDVSMTKRAVAVQNGAVEVTSRELVELMRGKYETNK